MRAFDLPAGHLIKKPVIDPRDAGEAMQGFPISRVMSGDGRWAYTLYLRPSSQPFVHALDTQRRVAVYVDLPALASQDVSSARLILGAGGNALRVEIGGAPAALIDTRTFKVATPARVAAPRPSSPAGRATTSHGGGLPWAWAILPAAGLLALALVARRRWRLRSLRPSGKAGPTPA